ncbi:MAG: alpha/beta hydrolase [Anaerovoracaceae bacterium]
MEKKEIQKAALRVISRNNFDLKKSYKLERKLKELKGPLPVLKRIFEKWNYEIFDGSREILTRVFKNKGEEENTIVYFHGGGWVTETIDSYNFVCYQLAKNTNSLVISVDYRLAPEYPFPAGLEDCYTVAKFAFEKHKEGLLPGKFVLMGDSAGGNLAAAVSLMGRDRGEMCADYQILLYPAVNNDHSTASPFDSIRENGTDYILTSERICDYMSMYKSCEADLNNPYFAPLLAGSFEKQPATMVITAEFDPLRDEGEEYGRKLAEAGNVVKLYRMKDALHGFISLGQHNVHVQKTYRLVKVFLERYGSEK